MARYVDFLGLDGKMYRAEKHGIDNALPIIEERIEKLLPLELVNIEEINNIVKKLNVDFKRDITIEEAKGIIELIKEGLIQEFDKLKKYYISKEDLKEINN